MRLKIVCSHRTSIICLPLIIFIFPKGKQTTTVSTRNLLLYLSHLSCRWYIKTNTFSGIKHFTRTQKIVKAQIFGRTKLLVLSGIGLVTSEYPHYPNPRPPPLTHTHTASLEKKSAFVSQ